MSQNLIKLFASLTHGVYVIGVAAGKRRNAFTAAWVMQTSFNPPMLALSINPLHASFTMLKAGGGFTVNVLATGQQELALHFARPIATEKLASSRWHESARGFPLLDEAPAWFECELAGECPSGDHVLVVGRVIDGGLVAQMATPMNYRQVSGADSAASLLPSSLSR